MPKFCWNTVGIGLASLLATQEISETKAFLDGSIGHRQSLRESIDRNKILIGEEAQVLVQKQRSTSVCLASTEEEDTTTSTTTTTSSNSVSVGPKAQGRRRSSRSTDRRTGSNRSPRRSSSSGPTTVGPRSTGPRPDRRRRTEGSASAKQDPMQQRQKSPTEPFDGKRLTAEQKPNSDAPRLDLRDALSSQSSGLRCVTQGVECFEKDKEKEFPIRPEQPYAYGSLDDLVTFCRNKKGITNSPAFSLSELFNSDGAFRKDLRSAIRLDVFETTPFYANLPEKAKSVLLLPDSSLEGSWRIPEYGENEKMEPGINGDGCEEDQEENNPSIRRMKHTTRVLNNMLKEHLGDSKGGEQFEFSGDDLFEAIGTICGDGASTHWIDIYGVQDRKINHSWHLDSGRSPKNCKTVLWGFPPEDHYCGTGVFSHVVSLKDPFGSTLDIVETDDRERPRMEPVLFEGTPGEDYVFRPMYEPGKELLIYRDIDVLHSAPDVAYRASVMRFM